MLAVHYPPQEDSCYSFLLEAESTPRAIVQLEALCESKKSSDLTGDSMHDLPLCSIVSQPATLLRASGENVDVVPKLLVLLKLGIFDEVSF
jgi:hypothetical protein